MEIGQVAVDHEEEMLKEISKADFETGQSLAGKH